MFSILLLVALTACLPALITAAPTLNPKFTHPAPYNFIADHDRDRVYRPSPNSITKRTIGGVTLSDGANFTGHVWHGVYPLDTCVALNDYAGDILSFRPDEGTECFVMQGRCNANADFADLYSNSTEDGNLGEYPWIKQVESYMCVTPTTV